MNKTKKINWLPLVAFTAMMVMAAVWFAGCEDDEPTNKPPVANAGSDFEHDIADGTSITLSGSGVDTDGTIASYAWTCTSSPENSFSSYTSTAQNPTVSGFTKLGDYVFTLKVTDNGGAESVGATVKVTLVRTATTTLKIDANSFSPAPVTQLNFAPSYSSISNAGDFTTANINSVLSYTVTVVNHDASRTHTWESTDGFNGILPASDEYYYGFDLATFTQTFYHNKQAVGSRTLIAYAEDGTFAFGQGYAPTGSLPAVNNSVSISRKVASGNIN